MTGATGREEDAMGEGEGGGYVKGGGGRGEC